MNLKKLSADEALHLKALIMQTCYVASAPRGPRYFAALTGLPKLVVERAARELEEDGYVKKRASGGWDLCAEKYAPEETCRMLRDAFPEGTVEYYVGCLEWASWADHVNELFHFLDEQLLEGNKRAVLLLDLTVQFYLMLGEKLLLGSDGHAEKYLMTCHLLVILCYMYRRMFKQALKTLSTWYAVFLRYRPSSLMSYLGMLEMFASKMGKGKRQIEAWSSLKSISQFAQASAEGEIPEAAEALDDQTFQKLQEASSGDRGRFLASVVSSMTHIMAYAADINNNISSEDHAKLRNLAETSPKVDMLGHYCFVLLYQGLFEEALEQLNVLAHWDETRNSPTAFASVVRGIAVYHFLHGRISHAYHVLKKETEYAVRKGIIHEDFWDPLVFDMFYVFEQHGYAPIPRYVLDEIIPYKLAHDKPLTAVAKRIKALRLRSSDLPGAIALLRESLAISSAGKNEREVIISSHELANSLTILGEYDEAQRLRKNVNELAGLAIEADLPYANVAVLATKMPNSPEWLKRAGEAVGIEGAGGFSSEHLEGRAGELARKLAGIEPTFQLKDMLVRVLEITDEVLPEIPFNIAVPQQDGCFALLRAEHSPVGKQSFLYLEESSWQRAKEIGVCYTRGCFYFSFEARDIAPWLLRLEVSTRQGSASRMGIYATGLLLRGEINKLVNRSAMHSKQGIKRTEEDCPLSVCGEERIVGSGMNAVLRQVEQAAYADAPVLILGETGVGKELVARHIHRLSGRSGAFVAVNAAGVSESLFESEFFGHERGAFTGAISQHKGLFEEADGGTIFIDEIGDIPFSMQAKLLRVLQDKNFKRVGGNKVLTSSFRLLTATNKNLQAEVEAGRFRSDLYFRISVFPIKIPALRHRMGDMLPLAEAYVTSLSHRYGKAPLKFTDAQKAALKAYRWPGNVRELRNVMERAVLQGEFAPEMLAGPMPRAEQKGAGTLDFSVLQNSYLTLAELERQYIEYIMRCTNGKVCGQDGAAALLGEKTSTMYAKLKRLGF